MNLLTSSLKNNENINDSIIINCNFAYPEFGVRKLFLYVCQKEKESLGLHQRGHCRENFQEDILSWLPLGLLKTKKKSKKFVQEGREWIERENQRRHPRLDLFGEERSGCEAELLSAEQMLSAYLEHHH